MSPVHPRAAGLGAALLALACALPARALRGRPGSPTSEARGGGAPPGVAIRRPASGAGHGRATA